MEVGAPGTNKKWVRAILGQVQRIINRHEKVTFKGDCNTKKWVCIANSLLPNVSLSERTNYSSICLSSR